jgi:Cupin
MLCGTCRITAIDAEGRNFVDDVGVGDFWYFPAGVPHSLQGLGPDVCKFLLVFDDGEFDEDNTFLWTDWFKHTPRDVVLKSLNGKGNLIILKGVKGAGRLMSMPEYGTAARRPSSSVKAREVGCICIVPAFDV